MLVLALNEFVQRCRYSLESPEGCCLQVLGLGFLVGEKAPSSWGGSSSWQLLGSFGSKGTVGHDCLLVFYLGFSVALGGEGARLSSIMLDLKASTSKLDRVVLYFCCTLFLLE